MSRSTFHQANRRLVMRFRSCTILLILALVVAGQATWVFAQSLTSGDLAGTVTDPSGAVVPNASVTLKSNESGTTQTRTTNAQGYYRFQLLSPGSYTVSVTASGFQLTQQQATITVGQAATVNIPLALGAASQTIKVSAVAEAFQTNNAEIST